MRLQALPLLIVALMVQGASAGDETRQVLFDGNATGAPQLLVPTSPQVSVRS